MLCSTTFITITSYQRIVFCCRKRNATNYICRCFLVDSSGFIVLHKDVIEAISSGRPPGVDKVHIGTKEPLIARHLEAANVMTKSACVNVQEFSNQYFWKVREGVGGGGQCNVDIILYAIDCSYSYCLGIGHTKSIKI